MKDKEFIDKWVKPITIPPKDLAWIWKDAEKILKELSESRGHWSLDALKNKRQGHSAEYCGTLMLSDLDFSYYWKTPRSPKEDRLRPYDIHIAKKHFEKGNLEIKTIEIGELYAEIKDSAWRHSKAHYVLIFEFLNPKVLGMDIKQIRKENRSLKIKFVGWLPRAKVDKKKPTPAAFASSRKFKPKEWHKPKTFLKLLLNTKKNKQA